MKLFTETSPDLILMDVDSPLLDGLSATRRIREDLKMRSVPVVAVSKYAMTEDQDRAREAGCGGYITKPINIDELDRVLKLLFTKGAKTDSFTKLKANEIAYQ
jgi:CheY-like chemotaxis protein